MGTPLDIFEDIYLPIEMRSYLRANGYNFSKKACEFAISKMRYKNPSTGKEERVEMKTKEQVEEILKKYNIKLENDNGYNGVYWYHQGFSDLFKSSVTDEQHLAMYVKDMIDDPDMPGSNGFRHWLSDCDAKGVVVDWADIL